MDGAALTDASNGQVASVFGTLVPIRPKLYQTKQQVG